MRQRSPQGGGGAGGKRRFDGRTVELFVGSASKPPTEELAKRFEERTGAQVILHFGGSGQMLTALELSRRGDIYFPGSSDFMDLAKRRGVVAPETEKRVVYLVPAMNVVRGNPKGIRTLDDLGREGIRVGIARPDGVCVGLYGVEVLERAGLASRVKPNIVTHAESCEKTAQVIALGSVDAVLGWSVFEHWDPEHVETVFLRPEQVTRIGYIPIGITTFAASRELAESFVEFATSEEGQGFYKKWKYFTSEDEARRHAKKDTPVGGEWELPEHWKR